MVFPNPYSNEMKIIILIAKFFKSLAREDASRIIIQQKVL